MGVLGKGWGEGGGGYIRLAYPRLICIMPGLTLCASWIYILEGGESAIMLHVPPVVCVSWGPGSWRDVSHTDLPSHNKGEEFYKYFGDKEDIKVTFFYTAENSRMEPCPYQHWIVHASYDNRLSQVRDLSEGKQQGWWQQQTRG